jgi:hypothetical protein
MTGLKDELARCDHHIADLSRRIVLLTGTSGGAGLLPFSDFAGLLQETIQSWEQEKRSFSKIPRMEEPTAQTTISFDL